MIITVWGNNPSIVFLIMMPLMFFSIIQFVMEFLIESSTLIPIPWFPLMIQCDIVFPFDSGFRWISDWKESVSESCVVIVRFLIIVELHDIWIISFCWLVFWEIIVLFLSDPFKVIVLLILICSWYIPGKIRF